MRRDTGNVDVSPPVISSRRNTASAFSILAEEWGIFFSIYFFKICFCSTSWWCVCLKSGCRAEISVQWLESPMWIDYPTLQLLTESEPVAAVTLNCGLHQHGEFSEAQRRVLMSSRYQRMGERNITHLPSIVHVLTWRGARLRLVYSSVMTLKTTSQLNAALRGVAAIAFADWHDSISWVFKITFIFRSWLRNIVFWVTG